MFCLKNLGTLCLQALMNSQLVMLMIPSFGNGMALNFHALALLIGSLLHHVAWFASWTISTKVNYGLAETGRRKWISHGGITPLCRRGGDGHTITKSCRKLKEPPGLKVAKP